MPWSSSFERMSARPTVAGLALLMALSLMPVPLLAQHEVQERLLKPFSAAIVAPPTMTARNGSIYVPAYAHLPVGVTASNVDFSVTLSTRNTSPRKAMVVRRIDFYETAGEPPKSKDRRQGNSDFLQPYPVTS